MWEMQGCVGRSEGSDFAKKREKKNIRPGEVGIGEFKRGGQGKRQICRRRKWSDSIGSAHSVAQPPSFPFCGFRETQGGRTRQARLLDCGRQLLVHDGHSEGARCQCWSEIILWMAGIVFLGQHCRAYLYDQYLSTGSSHVHREDCYFRLRL